MKKIVYLYYLLASFFVGTSIGYSQTEQSSDVYDMSLEELMNVTIVSASKKEETVFDAPVSSYSITREEITKAGITSIPEALRLCPDVLVRETTNGNYDIHIRGLDNLAGYTPTNMQVNAYTLVMIDNRPVFNYIQGGTFWESIPVSIVDVERIEVVRGPVASLFGPNAVSGVINIITRKIKEKNLQLAGQVQYGLPGNSANSSLSVGKRFSRRLSLRFSGNYEERERLDDQHYMYTTRTYVPSEEYVKSFDKGVDADLALRRYGANIFADIDFTKDVVWQLSAGYSGAQSQKVYFMNESPLTFSNLNAGYINLQGNIHDLQTRVSYTRGTDDVHQLSNVFTAKYDYSLLNTDLSYHVDVASWLSITPSLSYTSSTYTDRPYSMNPAGGEGDWFGGILDNEALISSLAGAVRTEVRPFKKLRVLASARIDKFNLQKDKYLSWQFATTYAPVKALLFRAALSRATTGIFYGYNYVSSQFLNPDGSIVEVRGNKELNLTTNTMAEAGVRVKLSERYQANITVFAQKVEDIIAYQHEGQQVIDNRLHIMKGYYNRGGAALQRGLSFSMNMVPTNQWQVRPFLTLQETDISRSTPASFGGLFINWEAADRISMNVTTYYFLKQEQRHVLDLGTREAAEAGNIEEKVLLNAAMAYRVYDKWKISLSGKNLLNKTSREYYGADRTQRTFFAGISYNF